MKKLLLVLLILFCLGLFFKTNDRDVQKQANNEKSATVGEKPSIPLMVPQGFSIGVFAKGLGAPRDIIFSEKGTLLASIPRDDKIVALPDKNNDGTADETKNILTGLDNPHGIAFFKGKLYVAEETRVVRYQWDEGTLTATKEKELFSLPKGGNHTTRTIAFKNNGQMFVSLGSTCNVCYEKHEWLAAVITSDENGNNPRLFAKGLRNSVFISINPQTDELWGTEMGRDFLGDNLPPDEINIIKDGKDYGWPVCYGAKIYDRTFNPLPQKASPCEASKAPAYEIPAHSAPLGLTFINSKQFPKEWEGDLLVVYHGSWNRSTPTGYKVVHLEVEGNTVKGASDFLTGFLSDTQALGRPADVVFDSQGSLYVSDDKAGTIYKITSSTN